MAVAVVAQAVQLDLGERLDVSGRVVVAAAVVAVEKVETLVETRPPT